MLHISIRLMTLCVLLALAIAPVSAIGDNETDVIEFTRGRMLNTIHPEAAIWNSGDLVVLTGPIGCPRDQVIEIRVRVSQPSGAVGDGRFSGLCSGEQSEWMAIVQAWSFDFKPGPANAHAWATVWNKDGVVRSWDWARDITLR